MPEQPAIALNEDGLVANPDQWDRDVATQIATSLGIEQLTEEHWQVMEYMRN